MTVTLPRLVTFVEPPELTAFVERPADGIDPRRCIICLSQSRIATRQRDGRNNCIIQSAISIFSFCKLFHNLKGLKLSKQLPRIFEDSRFACRREA
jgi:hypothetical protein